MIKNDRYIIPTFVAEAEPSSFDAEVPGAFVVEGYRLDNPAAIWKAAADARMGASISSSTRSLIDQACELFDITEEHFVEKKASDLVEEGIITITDGTHKASFNIYDRESLNKAASELLDSRDDLGYAFAHDCAHTLKTIAAYGNLGFDEDKVVAIRKLAADYPVNYDAVQREVESRIATAQHLGLDQEAAALSKIAAHCTTNCPAELVPAILQVLDQFDTTTTGDALLKQASEHSYRLEDVAFLSNEELLNKQANSVVALDSSVSIRRGSVEQGLRTGAIHKWAADSGYVCSSSASVDDAIALVATMPKALRLEFANLFQ